jgi:hypothetical protein
MDSDDMTPLQRAQQRIREMRAAGIAPERLDPTQRAARKPTSLRLAVTAKCWDCQGGDADGGVRLRVRDCPVARCSLHPVRPWQGRAAVDSDDEGEA